jgi:hypothetical protein
MLRLAWQPSELSARQPHLLRLFVALHKEPAALRVGKRTLGEVSRPRGLWGAGDCRGAGRPMSAYYVR